MIEHYVAFGLHMDQNANVNANTISSTVLQCKQVVALNNKAMKSLNDIKNALPLSYF